MREPQIRRGAKLRFIQSGLEALPSLDFVLLQPNIHTPERPEVQNIRPAKAERSGLGVVVGTPIYPDAPNGRQVGAVVGLYVASDFRGRWMLSLGVQWRYRPVASIETILTDHQLRYSFGYTLDEWRRQNWAVHYLEAPLRPTPLVSPKRGSWVCARHDVGRNRPSGSPTQHLVP